MVFFRQYFSAGILPWPAPAIPRLVSASNLLKENALKKSALSAPPRELPDRPLRSPFYPRHCYHSEVTIIPQKGTRP